MAATEGCAKEISIRFMTSAGAEVNGAQAFPSAGASPGGRDEIDGALLHFLQLGHGPRLVAREFHQVAGAGERRRAIPHAPASGVAVSCCIWRRNSSVVRRSGERMKTLAEIGADRFRDSNGIGRGIVLPHQGARLFQVFQRELIGILRAPSRRRGEAGPFPEEPSDP